MKRTLTITFLSAAAFAVGCNSQVEESAPPTNIQAAADKAKVETKEAAQGGDASGSSGSRSRSGAWRRARHSGSWRQRGCGR